MKKQKIILNFIFIIISLLIISLSIINNEIFINTFISTLTLWLYKVMPFIFTFYIIISIFMKLNILQKFLLIFKPLNKLLKFETAQGFYLYITSIFVGNPSAANLVQNSYNNNSISYNDYKSLIDNASFITPLFIFSIFPNKISFSLILISSHIISSFIITSINNRKNKFNYTNSFNIVNNTSISKIFNNSINIILNIAAVMIFSNLIISSLKMLYIPDILLLPLELSTGIFKIIELFQNSIISLILVSILLSFNGICIHLQISSQIDNFNYKSFVFTRLIQSLNSGLLTYFIWYIVTSLTP